MRAVTPRPILDIAAVADGWHVLDVSVDWVGNPVVLCSEKLLGYDLVRTEHGFQSKRRSEGPSGLHIHHIRGGSRQTTTLPEAEWPDGLLARLLRPDEWLVIRRRAAGTSDRNALIYSRRGDPRGSIHLGDAILDVQVAPSGKIWASYFDEGVYGGGPPSEDGLACFDPNGTQVFGYGRVASELGLPPVDDCYAINVVDDRETWLCYYSAFPLVKLLDLRVSRVWEQFAVAMAHSFAVAGNRALFCGGSVSSPEDGPIPVNQVSQEFVERVVQELEGRQRWAPLHLVDLDTLQVEGLQAIRDDGTPLESFSAFGRGSRLYLRTTDTLFLLELDEL